jgi:serine/threonine-protein kinase
MTEPTNPDDNPQRRLEEAMAEYLMAADASRSPEPESFLALYPDLRAELVEFLADLSALAGLVGPLLPAAVPPEPDLVTTPPLSGDTTDGRSTTTTDPGATISMTSITGTETTAHPWTTATLGEGSYDAEALATLLGGTRVRYFGDYELIRELGRGGMGVVYKARQISLNRPVALKMIKAAALASGDERRRFQNEAEAIATLDHPHIVPILEVGDHYGQRYFTMKLIGGTSLDKKLAEYGADPTLAARLMRQAAQAVHHAHQRGILHRDLKPANILLDERSEPFVTDFGLAKRVEGDSELTLSGAIIGTPGYMAPEQASGQRGAVTTASDVYGLGAVLYALLTGRAPFRSDSVTEVLRQVREQPPVPPSRLNPRTPRDLEIICLKCLEKDPARRYPSAAELAEDLRRFEAGETVRARPVGRPERLWRWCRREPALAALALALVAGLLGVATQWHRAEAHLKEALRQRGRAEAHLANSLEQRSRAEKNARKEVAASRRAQGRFDLAMTVLENLETITKDSALLREPRLEGLRSRLLQTALDFYQKLQSSLEEDASPGARLQLFEAYLSVAHLTWELGRQGEALATYRRALALVEQIAAAAPADAEARSALARCHTRIGFTFRTMARPAEALRAYEQAREIQDSLVRDHPETARYREFLSWTLSQLGVIELEFGRPAEAIGLHRQAIAIHEALVGRDPDVAVYRNDLGYCWRCLSQALAASGDREAALRMAAQAVALYDELVRADRGCVEYRWRLARCLDEVGRICTLSGRPAEAAQPLERALELHEALARDDPVFYDVDVIRNRLYAAYQRLRSGRPEDAAACMRKVEDVLSRTPQVRPALLLQDLACSHILWSAAGREGAIGSAEREARIQRAIAVLRRVVVTGHVDLEQVRLDPVLDPLRLRRDFQEMILDLSFPADPF